MEGDFDSGVAEGLEEVAHTNDQDFFAPGVGLELKVSIFSTLNCFFVFSEPVTCLSQPVFPHPHPIVNPQPYSHKLIPETLTLEPEIPKA